MKDFKNFLEESDSLSSYNKHKVRVKVSKDGGEKHHVDVKVFADSAAEAKGIARLRLKSKGYETHSAIHQGIDTSWLKKEEVEQIDESSNDHYAESEAHLNKASKALETSDMAAHHFHMSNHHEAKGRWHEEKGRHSSADREYAKAEEHHEKSIKPNNSKSVGVKNEEVKQIDELSSDTLQSYKEKAKKSADELTAKGEHGKSLDRTMFRMRATGKQIDKTTAGIKKALNKEETDKGEYDYEGQMARTQLQTTLRNCEDLIDMIKDDDNMPEWVQSKITLAQDYITTVRDYLQSKEELGEGVKSPGVGWMIRQDPKLKAAMAKHKEKMKEFKSFVGTKVEPKDKNNVVS
jgi:hypothetical protein